MALIAWPVGISSGAWLPPIWGERGWKVPTKIAARSQYEEIVALMIGFMQHLDRELLLERAIVKKGALVPGRDFFPPKPGRTTSASRHPLPHRELHFEDLPNIDFALGSVEAEPANV